MPQMDRPAATRAIRALPGDAGAMPIIAMTVNAFAEDRARCLAAGMNDHIAKPDRPVDARSDGGSLAGRRHRPRSRSMAPRRLPAAACHRTSSMCRGAAGNSMDRGLHLARDRPERYASMLRLFAEQYAWPSRQTAGRAGCWRARGRPSVLRTSLKRFVGDDRGGCARRRRRSAWSWRFAMALQQGGSKNFWPRWRSAAMRCAQRSNPLWPIDSPLHSAAALRWHPPVCGRGERWCAEREPLHERCTVLLACLRRCSSRRGSAPPAHWPRSGWWANTPAIRRSATH